MFNDRRKLPKLADPKLQGRYPMRGLYQALAVASMCIQGEAASRPLIADVVTALAYLASQAYDPGSGPNSNNRSGGERRIGDGKGGRMLAKDEGASGHKWELDAEKEHSPREMVGILNRDFDRERAVAEAKMWGENWREKRRADANLEGGYDAASGNG